MKSILSVWLLAGPFHQSAAAQIAEYGPAQLARQAVDIRAPYLAQMAQVQYGATSSKAGARRSPVQTTFKRAAGWFKPWSMANEISKRIEWDPKAPLGTGFAREEAQRQALTKLFTACLDTYEEQAKAEGLATDDLAVTYGHALGPRSTVTSPVGRQDSTVTTSDGAGPQRSARPPQAPTPGIVRQKALQAARSSGSR